MSGSYNEEGCEELAEQVDARNKLLDKIFAAFGEAWDRTGDILDKDDPAQSNSDRLVSLLKVLTDHWMNVSMPPQDTHKWSEPFTADELAGIRNALHLVDPGTRATTERMLATIDRAYKDGYATARQHLLAPVAQELQADRDRWAERVKLLEERAARAIECLQGGGPSERITSVRGPFHYRPFIEASVLHEIAAIRKVELGLEPPSAKMREQVREFNEKNIVERLSKAQLVKLRENRGKGGWEKETVGDLFALLYDELSELHKAIDEHGSPAEVLRECADVANFVAMIADVYANGEEK